MYRKILKEVFLYITAGFIIWYCCILIINGVSIKEGITEAIERCLNVIIPSLFAFMAMSEIITESGLYSKISAPFALVSKYILKIPPQLFFIFLLGNIAGYPVGIKLLSSMTQKKQISKRTAEIMSCFCYCGGPAFYSGTIGIAVFGNTRAGIIIFLSIVITNLLMSAVLCRIFKIEENSFKKEISISPQLFTDSIISAGKSLFTICILVVFFSTVMSAAEHYRIFEILQSLGFSENAVTLFKSLLEITAISELSGQPFGLLPMAAAVCSFGGICVIIQVIALNKKAFPLKMFMASRLVSALLSAVFCNILSEFILPDSIPAAAITKSCFVKTDNFIPSICLILMILLLMMKKRLAFSKKL